MIYAAQIGPGGPVKIGCTADVAVRLGELEQAYGETLCLLATMDGGREEERQLHRRFSHLRLGRTEQFQPAPDLMEFLGRPLLASANPDTVEIVPSPKYITLRGTQAWVDWVMEFADFRRLRATDLIDQALIDSAQKHGFNKPAPKR